MRMTTRRLFGAAALLALSTAGLLGGTATAKPEADPVDPRAVVVGGNLEWDKGEDPCGAAGLSGTAMDGDLPPNATTETLPHTTDGIRSITITGGLEGFVVTGVVVKGGNDSNVYFVDAPDGTVPLGELAWEKLTAPITNSGKAADISHWFFCVEKDTTPENPGGENPGGENPGGENPGGENPGEENPGGENPGETTSSVAPTTNESVAVTPTSTTAPAAAAGANDGDLANTGYNGGWMLIVGLGLVAAGAAFVASPKLRGLLRR